MYKVMNFIMTQVLSKIIIQVCAEKKNLRLKLMMYKLGKSNEVLKIFIYYFYKNVFIKICIFLIPKGGIF